MPTFKANCFGDVMQLNKTLCLWENTNHDMYMKNNFPEYSSIHLIRKSNNDDILEAVKAGTCDAALIGKSSFRLFQRDDEDCRVGTVSEKTLLSIQGSFALSADAGTKCTSLISYVLDLYMSEMKKDGFYDAAWDEVMKSGNSKCIAKQESAKFKWTTEEVEPLTLENLSGISRTWICFLSINCYSSRDEIWFDN